MKIVFLLATLMIVSAALASGQTVNNRQARNHQAEKEVLKVNKEYGDAIVRGDLSAYDRIVADDYIHTGSNGGVVGKAQQMEEMKTTAGDVKIEFGRGDDERVRVYGQAAVVTGRWEMKGKYKGEDFSEEERYTAVYVKRQGRWRLVAEQTTRIAKK
jgi:ketosteroid isomerase-like protein